MKVEVTAKTIRNAYGKKLAIGYCGAWHLLSGRTPMFYTCGVYGWNNDVYLVGDTWITTGYRNLIGTHPNFELLKEYEAKAQEICESRIDYEERTNKVNALLDEFIAKCF